MATGLNHNEREYFRAEIVALAVNRDALGVRAVNVLAIEIIDGIQTVSRGEKTFREWDRDRAQSRFQS